MWSIIFKELRFAVLDKTCAKQRPQLCCCLKLAPNHTAQLLFCFKLNGIVEKLRLVQKTVHNCPVAQNGVKTLCATVALVEIGALHQKA